ncbi:MAG: cysteine--tRNA ligase [Oscillospiraceae bacterium]|nr:cysteine--tRNA ligase [Oscillospiraceae bacterium]
MSIYFYNTLTKSKEKFTPLDGNIVRIYTCGPTVYKDATIGNMKSFIFMDTLRRVLKYNGYDLKHVMNITDVGHLVSDGDEGEDKMAKAAKEEQKTPLEIAGFYTERFLNDIDRLNIERPEIICKATDHIKEMEEFVEELLKNGYAYETSTAIYFDVSKLDDYGILSGIDLREQKAGARVEVDKEKKNPYDFAVWIKAPENHIMKWESPWGLCYPGWHIECSAMSKKYLGEVFDIHTGGIDLVPTHHENEIAQSKGVTGKIPAKFWMHCEFLLVDGGKMSKSLGNGYLVEDLETRKYDPLAYKLMCFSSHYRNKLNFTWDSLEAARSGLNKLREGYQKHNLANLEDVINTQSQTEEYRQRFLEAINDDLNMPVAMSVVWEIIKNPNKSNKFAELLLEFDKVLGLDIDKDIGLTFAAKATVMIEDSSIKSLMKQREKAREEKNWQRSDELRDELKAMGYIVKDTSNGQEITKI